MDLWGSDQRQYNNPSSTHGLSATGLRPQHVELTTDGSWTSNLPWRYLDSVQPVGTRGETCPNPFLWNRLQQTPDTKIGNRTEERGEEEYS
jgi:hypothetical protein